MWTVHERFDVTGSAWTMNSSSECKMFGGVVSATMPTLNSSQELGEHEIGNFGN
jgi:hypothetical protein